MTVSACTTGHILCEDLLPHWPDYHEGERVQHDSLYGAWVYAAPPLGFVRTPCSFAELYR